MNVSVKILKNWSLVLCYRHLVLSFQAEGAVKLNILYFFRMP